MGMAASSVSARLGTGQATWTRRSVESHRSYVVILHDLQPQQQHGDEIKQLNKCLVVYELGVHTISVSYWLSANNRDFFHLKSVSDSLGNSKWG